MRRRRSACRQAMARSSLARRPTLPSGTSALPPSSPTPWGLTPALGVSEAGELFDKRAQLRAQPVCQRTDKTKRRRFVHIRGLGELELHRVHALHRVAVSARDVAALEAPVEHRAVARDLLHQPFADTEAA